MFLKELKILSEFKEIRTIQFHKGLNLIVDESFSIMDTSNIEHKTGNSIGKTTVLKLIDYCMGGNRNDVFTDPENTKNMDGKVKTFLEQWKVRVILTLKVDLQSMDSKEVKVERNFLPRKNRLCKLNEVEYKNDEEFNHALKGVLYPDLNEDKPSLSQLLCNNIRYKDIRINNTIYNLHPNTKAFEYETLYLYMLGNPIHIATEKLALQAKIKQEKLFLSRLQKFESKNAYMYSLRNLEEEVKEIQKKKENLNINEDYCQELEALNDTKTKIGFVSAQISNLKIKHGIIQEGLSELDANVSHIDVKELKALYEDANNYVEQIQSTFEELVNYHNKMLIERKKYLEKDLGESRVSMISLENELQDLLVLEKKYSYSLKKTDTLEDIEKVNKALNDKYKLIGEYENKILQISESEQNLIDFDNEIKAIEEDVFSQTNQDKVVTKINIFNRYFSKYSKILYDEVFQLKHEVKITKEGQKYYFFSPYSMATSSGKKQGEALAFDLAYIEYAENEKISHVNFLLNDKKELMDINQIKSIVSALDNVQLIFSILQDKLPDSLNTESYVVLRLSQTNKLFRIEELEQKL